MDFKLYNKTIAIKIYSISISTNVNQWNRVKEPINVFIYKFIYRYLTRTFNKESIVS